MFFFDCEKGFVPDNGQNDVTDGSVENFDFNWDEPQADDAEPKAGDTPQIELQPQNAPQEVQGRIGS